MILGFDIGNTSTTMALYARDAALPIGVRRYPTDKETGPEQLLDVIRGHLASFPEANGPGCAITGLALASVVPGIIPAYTGMSRLGFGLPCLAINHESRLSIRLNYLDPAQLGPDRIVNAEAALIEYGGGHIIIDIGTAATFCVLLEDGTFDGGLIAPGIGTTIEALANRTSRLPRIDFGKPDRLVARDTLNAVKSGFYYGWLSLVEGVVGRLREEYGTRLGVLLTGGYAERIAPDLRIDCTVDMLLTMKGIKYVFDKNLPGID